MKKLFIAGLINLLVFNAVNIASEDNITATQKCVSEVEVHDVSGFVGMRMQANKDNHLKKFDIPFDLIRDKTDALGQKVDIMTIKFKAKTNVAGGVSDLYTHF